MARGSRYRLRGRLHAGGAGGLAIPGGVLVGTATDTLTIDGAYTSGYGDIPYGVPAFTLSLIIPHQVSIAAPNDVPPNGLFITTANGHYADGIINFALNSTAVEFGNFVDYGNGVAVPSVDPASQFSFTVHSILAQYDTFFFSADTALNPVYTFSGNGHTATARAGLIDIISGGSSYNSP